MMTKKSLVIILKNLEGSFHDSFGIYSFPRIGIRIRSGLRDVRAAETKRVNPKSARRLRCASLGSIADMKMKVEISCFTFTNFRDDELLF